MNSETQAFGCIAAELINPIGLFAAALLQPLFNFLLFPLGLFGTTTPKLVSIVSLGLCS
jgi:hypothetical protein